MSEQILDNALTTVARVKDRLGITTGGHDTLLLRGINAVTTYIERETGRRFLEQTHAEITPTRPGQNVLYLHNAPVSAITALEYRAGLPSNPTWTAWSADEYELIEMGNDESNAVRVYGGVPHGTNTVRCTYTGGYKIDFANAGDPDLHTLPFDLTDVCERIVVTAFRRRNSEGKIREASESSSVDWAAGMTKEDRAVLDRYSRPVI